MASDRTTRPFQVKRLEPHGEGMTVHGQVTFPTGRNTDVRVWLSLNQISAYGVEVGKRFTLVTGPGGSALELM